MNEPLRPSNLGEILDRALQFYRARFLVFFAIAALPAGAMLAIATAFFLIFLWFGNGGPAQAQAALATVLAILLLLAMLFLALPVGVAAPALATAALNHAAAQAYRDEKITVLGSYRAAWKLGWRYLLLYVLDGLIVMVAPWVAWNIIVFFAAILGAAAGAGDVLIGLAAVGGIVALTGWFLLARVSLWLAFPACVVERIGAWESLKRAYQLGKGTRWRLLVLWLLGAALSQLLTLALAVPLLVAIELIPGASSPQHKDMAGTAMLFVFLGASFAVQALTRPLISIALLLFYYDQRIRHEAYDIELLMQQAGMAPPPLPEQEAAPWMPPIVRAPHTLQPEISQAEASGQPVQSPATPGEPS
jgi:hypothetical protein